MRRRLRGLSERDWRLIDRLFVVVLFTVAEVDLVTNSSREGPLWANLAVMGAVTASFLWRRSRPLATLAVTLAGMFLMASTLTEPPDVFAAVLVVVTACYSVGAHATGRRALVGLGAGAGGVLAVALAYDPNDVFFPVVFFAMVPWLAGRTIRNQTQLARELAEKAERAEHARADEERLAIARERSRIARELHDVLAHNLSVMVVQASAARRIAAHDPGRAAAAAEQIQTTGREALAEIRHLFGPVRRGEGELLASRPGLGGLDGLVARARRAGLSVELLVEGEPVELPAGVDLTAYRVVQEALTNSLKHAGSTRAEVTVSYEPNELVLSIEDDGMGAPADDGLGGLGGGHGLAGMRERVELYGGLLQAGRRRGGGFAVRARLPTRPLVPGAQLSGASGTVSA
jgi:signal transduction histidine kinase